MALGHGLNGLTLKHNIIHVLKKQNKTKQSLSNIQTKKRREKPKKMAQAQPEKKENAKEITEELGMKEDDQSSNVGFRFNAEAPEFVPRSQSMSPTTSVPVSGYFYPCYHFLGGSHSANSSADWIFIEDQHEPTPPPPQASSINYWITNPNNNSNDNNNNKSLPNCSKKINAIPDDLQHKIIKQVIFLVIVS